MIDITCIGHITRDVIVTPRHRATLPGGTAYYVAMALHNLPQVRCHLVTAVGHDSDEVVARLRERDVMVDVTDRTGTVTFENTYGNNRNNRSQRVTGGAAPFTASCVADIRADVVHVGTLLNGDCDLATLQAIAQNNRLSVDAQGLLRHVVDGRVEPCDWTWKREALPLIDILKVNEHEIVSLTGQHTAAQAARQLADWGAREVLITLGDRGSIIYCDGKLHAIAAYKPQQCVDVTGCGDTYAAGYLYCRGQGASPDEAGHFAAAMATLKIERSGPFKGEIEDVNTVMREAHALTPPLPQITLDSDETIQ